MFPHLQTIDWAGGMIDWSSPAYTASNSFTAHVQWVSIDCYSGSDLNLPFVAGNSSSNSTSSRLRQRSEDEWPMLWERQSQTVNSYIWGSQSIPSASPLADVELTRVLVHSERHERSDRSVGLGRGYHHQLALLDWPEQCVGSPLALADELVTSKVASVYAFALSSHTVLRALAVIVKNGDTKGVTAPKSGSNGTGIFGNTAAGNWWAKQSTAVVRLPSRSVASRRQLTQGFVWSSSTSASSLQAAQSLSSSSS